MFDDVVEVHIADGINMGTTAALKELEAKELFMEDTAKQLEFFWAILTIQQSEKGK